MPCEWRGHMASDYRTSLFIVIEGNGFSKLKGSLKYDNLFTKLHNLHCQSEDNILDYKALKQ
jgi:hypothetical protein